MKAIVVVSDLHVGSFSGLSPNSFRLDTGDIITPSRPRQMLLDFWEHFWDKFVPAKVSGCDQVHVVLNGDILDGVHHQAVDSVPNLESQRGACVELLTPIRQKYDALILIRGTEAHGGKSEQDTEDVGRSLDTVKDADTGNYSHYQYWTNCEGIIFQFAHHIGTTSSAAYETSALMRELVAGLVENSQWGQTMPDIMVRSHRHRYNKVMFPVEGNKDRYLYVTPGWQLRTPFVEKIDRMRLPHIGGIVFLCEDGTWTEHRKIYEMPKPKINQM